MESRDKSLDYKFVEAGLLRYEFHLNLSIVILAGRYILLENYADILTLQ